MTATRFAAGSGAGYVTDTVLALSDGPGIDAELMRLCSTSTEWGPLVDAAHERNVTALVMHDDDRLHLAVTGTASVVVEIEGENRCFAGTDSWAMETVEHAHVVTLSCASSAPARMVYRTDGGVVPASVISRRLVAASEGQVDPFEMLFGHTVARSVESAAVRPAVDARRPRAPLGILVFATGERVVVDGTIVFGRDPRRLDDEEDAMRSRLVRLEQPGVSRRHAVIRLDRWSASIEDLGSTNGTTVAQVGRPAVDLRPGHPLDLAVGAVVDLGGEASFVVEEIA